jgi:acyl-CoA thioesterase-2
VLAQALIASGRTVDPDRGVHSLHAYFNRPGDRAEPIEFRVERLRDGRAYTSRRTIAVQGDRQILLMTSSFHMLEDGIDHHDSMPPAAEPDALPLWRNVIGTPEGSLDVRDWGALDLGVDDSMRAPNEHRQQIWLRSAGPLPDDPLLHVATLAYASDLTLLAPAVLPEDDRPRGFDPRGRLSRGSHERERARLLRGLEHGDELVGSREQAFVAPRVGLPDVTE